jgi:hypothetical protein
VQVNRLDGAAVLMRLATLFSTYPPHPNDYPILLRRRALGLEPGEPFDPAKLDPTIVTAINTASKDALEDLAPSMRKIGRFVNDRQRSLYDEPAALLAQSRSARRHVGPPPVKRVN